MIPGRYGHRATRLPDATVLVTGGVPRTGGPADGVAVGLYDTGSGTWTATANMEVGVGRYHTATLLLDGKVLVVSGFRGVGLSASAELYGPADGS